MSIDRRALLRALPATLLPVTLITEVVAAAPAPDPVEAQGEPVDDVAIALSRLEAALQARGISVADWELRMKTRRGWFIALDRAGNRLV
jgi:hypothetical protein